MKKEKKGPQFIKYFIPLINVLKNLGGSGSSREVKDLIFEELGIKDIELEETVKSGASRIENQIHWARLYLVKSGYLDSSERGVWSLTEKGFNSNLDYNKCLEIFNNIQSIFIEKYKKKRITKESGEKLADLLNEENDKNKLLDILKSLSPTGFERISQRLLRESGFQQVTITQKSRDGGFDGEGILQINPLVSFKVLFQCKRYQDAVSSPVVSQFRGTLSGRADKGIIITTGRFTSDAKKEAVREGATPVELVDGEKLIEMFENLKLGLIPKIVYDVDEKFFEDYK